MDTYETQFADTQALYKLLHWYLGRFQDRKSALQDLGVLSDLTARDHVVNEWVYDIDKRLRALEGVLSASTGAEHEQPVEIPTSVNHLGNK